MFNDIYGSNSNWLKADDLQGAKPVVTIATAEVKENTYDGVTKKQIVLTFEGKDKCLGLNFTNAQRIAELTGTEDFSQWIGVSIKLYTDKVVIDGTSKPCIRIFPELPEQNGKAKAAQQFSGPPVSTVDEDLDSIPF